MPFPPPNHHCQSTEGTSTHTHTHTRLTALFPGTTQVSWYQKGKTNLDFTEARDSEWQWHQLGHMQVCTLLQTDNHTSTPPLSFFIGRMPFLLPNQQCQSIEGTSTEGKCRQCYGYYWQSYESITAEPCWFSLWANMWPHFHRMKHQPAWTISLLLARSHLLPTTTMTAGSASFRRSSIHDFTERKLSCMSWQRNVTT